MEVVAVGRQQLMAWWATARSAWATTRSAWPTPPQTQPYLHIKIYPRPQTQNVFHGRQGQGRRILVLLTGLMGILQVFL